MMNRLLWIGREVDITAYCSGELGEEVGRECVSVHVDGGREERERWGLLKRWRRINLDLYITLRLHRAEKV